LARKFPPDRRNAHVAEAIPLLPQLPRGEQRLGYLIQITGIQFPKSSKITAGTQIDSNPQLRDELYLKHLRSSVREHGLIKTLLIAQPIFTFPKGALFTKARLVATMSPPGQGLQESPQPRPTDPLNVSQTTGGLCLVPCLYQNLRKSLALAYNFVFFFALSFSQYKLLLCLFHSARRRLFYLTLFTLDDCTIF
jgi:hypothetical protein